MWSHTLLKCCQTPLKHAHIAERSHTLLKGFHTHTTEMLSNANCRNTIIHISETLSRTTEMFPSTIETLKCDYYRNWHTSEMLPHTTEMKNTLVLLAWSHTLLNWSHTQCRIAITHYWNAHTHILLQCYHKLLKFYHMQLKCSHSHSWNALNARLKRFDTLRKCILFSLKHSHTTLLKLSYTVLKCSHATTEILSFRLLKHSQTNVLIHTPETVIWP